MKKIKAFFFCIVFFPFLTSCIWTQPRTITILHTNDIHAAVYPREAGWIRSNVKPLIGGFAELWCTVDSIRRVNPHTLLFDGGDVMTGSPIAEYDYMGATGGAIFQMMNFIGYDAWTIGNHDLDNSQENLLALTHIAKFPTLSANLKDTANRFPLNNERYLILEKYGLKIGIFGLMSDELFSLTNTTNLKGLNVLPGVRVAQEIINEIDPKTDLIIAVSHRGVREDSILATVVKGLDVIVGGHSHTRLVSPKVVNGVIIVQAGAYCENLGVLDLTVENDEVTSHRGQLIQLWHRGRQASPEMMAVLNDFKTKIDKDYSVIIGKLSEDWKRVGSEYALGNFYTNAIREAAKADVAFANSSGIRKDLLSGNVTKLDVLEVAPFRNVLCTFELTGKELRGIVQRYLQSLVTGGTNIHISGIQCNWKRSDGSAKIVSLKINGKDIDDKKIYRCASHDYLLNQSQRYLELQPQSKDCTNKTIFDVLVEKIQREKILKTPKRNFTELKER